MKTLKQFLLTLTAAVLLIPVLSASASAITTSEIQSRADKYISALGLTGGGCNYYWNRGVTAATLKNQLDAFRSSGNASDLMGHLSTNKCSYHDGGCTSNNFSGSSQCRGFVRYFMYYLYGADPFESPESYNTYTSATASWESIGGLQVGDHIDYNRSVFNHPFVYYSGVGTQALTAIHANGLSTRHPCGINFDVVYSYSGSPLTASDVESAYRAGNVTIRRYKNLTTCAHPKYTFHGDYNVTCDTCGEAYVLPALSGYGAFMDVVDVNDGSKTAPTHVTPYGDATIKTRYELGDTVYVLGSVTNAFGKTWCQLATGEWMVGSYLGDHVHRPTKDGFCPLCLDQLSIVYMNPTPLAAQSEPFPIHYAPYGASEKFLTTSSSKVTENDVLKTCSGSVEVNGKIINGYGNVWYSLTSGGWVWGDYINSFAQLATVSASIDALAMNNAAAPSPSQSRELFAVPAGASIYIYPDETSGSWYSASYDIFATQAVGFVYKSFVTPVDDHRGIEPPPGMPEPGLDAEETPPAPPAPPAAPEVYVYYPSDPEYLAKFAVSDTNATVVANIIKPAGTHVSACGLLLYDSSGNLIKDHYEPISNVGDALTSFHAWYDIQSELGLTLTPGTTYLYKIYVVVDGVTYEEGQYSFTTTITNPPEENPPEEIPPEEIPPEETVSTLSGSVIGGRNSVVTIGELSTPVSDDGTYTLATGNGIFTVVITTPGALTHTVKNIVVMDGDFNVIDATIVWGDTNGDEMINIVDMGFFRQNFGKTGESIKNIYTDTNADGMVNILDMSVFRTNFGKTAANDCTFSF